MKFGADETKIEQLSAIRGDLRDCFRSRMAHREMLESGKRLCGLCERQRRTRRVLLTAASTEPEHADLCKKCEASIARVRGLL
jgi:hypothetical protein